MQKVVSALGNFFGEFSKSEGLTNVGIDSCFYTSLLIAKAGASGHGGDFGEGGLADGGVRGVVALDEGFHEIGALEDDAASSVLRGSLAEVFEKGALVAQIDDID